MLSIRVLFFAVIFLYSFHLQAAETSQQPLLDKARDLIYNFDPQDENILPLLSKARESFAFEPDSCTKNYWLSRTEFLFGMAYRRKNDNVTALGYFEHAKDLIMQAIQCGDFPEGYAHLSEIYVQILWCKGITYQLKNLDKARDIPLKALQADPNNITARQSLAVFYIKAPQIMGGNIDKGISLLTNYDNKDKAESFKNYYILGTAYRKKGDLHKAIHYFQLALSLYPQNKWVSEDLGEICKNNSAQFHLTDHNLTVE